MKLVINELKYGWKHFSVFLSCLILGVTIMSMVNTLGSIVQNSLTREAQSLLGGNFEIRVKGIQATDEQIEFMQQYGTLSYVTTLRTMLRTEQMSSLVELKAVDQAYPLLGKIELQGNQPASNSSLTLAEALDQNGIAVDPIILSQFNVKIGDKVKIGNGEFTIRASISHEPDKAVQVLNFGPRLMMSQTSLDETGLISQFSLAEHRYRFMTSSGLPITEDREKQIEQELIAEFPDTSWRVNSGNDSNNSLKRFLDQLIAFMNLSGLATFLIAGIGIGSSVRTYLEKKSATIAVLKVQGASRAMVLKTYTSVISALVLIGGLVGMSLSALITLPLVPVLAEYLPSLAGQTGFYAPASLLALWYGFLITFLFSVPALFSAVDIKPSILFRTKITALTLSTSKFSHIISGILLLLLMATLILNAQDKNMIIGAIVVISVAFLLFGLCARGIKKITKHIKVKTPWLKLALGNIHRPGSSTTTVVYAIGISLTVLIALTLTEANFQSRIQQIVETRAPSLFVIDIQPQQDEDIQKLFAKYADADATQLSPMIRGRITKIAGKPVEEVEVDEEVSWAVRGDRGISFSARAPENANIVKGEWWTEDYKGEPLVSIDERFVEGMGVDIGDTMTIRILGEDITARISSVRKIDYTSFQINFALMLSLGEIEEFPHTSLATIYLKNQDQELELIQKLAQDFPNVTPIRTREVVGLVQRVMNHIALALSITVGISVIAGLLVLTSALSATIRQRMYDIAILKVLGARRSDILKSCSAEWFMLALIASILASLIGSIAAVLINSALRGQEFQMMPAILITIIIICMMVIWCIGALGNRKLFRFRPASLLRNE